MTTRTYTDEDYYLGLPIESDDYVKITPIILVRKTMAGSRIFGAKETGREEIRGLCLVYCEDGMPRRDHACDDPAPIIIYPSVGEAREAVYALALDREESQQ